MTMEKNGAISSQTPTDGGCRCNCEKRAVELRQLELFPQDAQTADALDGCLAKKAAEAVRNASLPVK